jgi:CubicO group peptidase (beta-lactamase class C family)
LLIASEYTMSAGRPRTWWSGLLLLAVPLGAAADNNKQTTTIDHLVTDALVAWDVPGAAVVIVTRDRVVSLNGYGRRELGHEQPVTADTIFPLASCTKAFTTTVLAMLADEGILGWDDPVRRHWPDFHLADPLADKEVTLRDLLTHRTGVASHDFLWYRSRLSPEELVRRVGKLPLERSFRSAFQYQSIMYTAAGLAAGRAGGTTWDELVRKRIFAPLGMSTATTTTPEPSPDLAVPHRPDRDGRLRVIPWYVQREPNAAGSVHASARDLAAWLQFQIGDGTYGGRRLVSAENLAETHTPQFALRLEGIVKESNPDSLQMSYGLAWVIQDYRGHLLVSHAGTIDGFRAHITLLPRDGYALAILANRHHTRMNLALSNMLVDQLLGLPAKDWHAFFRGIVRQEEAAKKAVRDRRDRERQPGTRPSRPLAEYAGVYEHPAYGRATVTMSDGRLQWEWSSFRVLLEHFQVDTFVAKDENLDDPLMDFAITANEGVTGFTFLNLHFKRVRG